METYSDEYEMCPHCGYVYGTPAEEAIHIEPGTVLHNRYQVGRVLGYGGFGVTYLGWDTRLEQKVAIKEYLPTEFSTRMPHQTQVTVFEGDKSEQFNDGMTKFVEEAKKLAKFQSESGIVKIFDSFQENDTAYIIMEYLDGEILTTYLQNRGTIDEDEAVRMLIPVMKSLKVVHDAGLLHRDIAPDNIFITKDGNVKLIDFGSARYATTSHSRSLTVIVKPGYSPEEQYRSHGDQGPHTDVYALGATLYKMITGKTPPDAMERRTTYETKSKDILTAPHKLCKGISPSRENAILNAMNVRIEDRTPDIDTFLSELQAEKVKRRYGKIKRIDVYAWPIWLKIALPAVLSLLIVFGALLATGVIKFSLFSSEIVVPEGMVVVPDVENMDKDEAINEIQTNKLVVSTGGNITSKYIEAGKIVLQDPTGGTYLQENGTVVLTISRGTGEVVEAKDGISTVPYVIWDKKEDAIDKLKKAGLKEPDIVEKYDDAVAEGSVISQSEEPGKQVPEGTKITLTISLGPESFEMPDVVGTAYEQAKNTLSSKGLSVTVEYTKNDSVSENSVVSQSISAGKKVKRGDSVVLTVSSGKKTVEVANVVGMSEDEARKTLKGQGFNVSTVEDYSANYDKGLVFSQTPEAETTHIPGETILINISLGKQPVSVSFDSRGGKNSANSLTVYYSDTYGELPTAAREGYTFDGWYTSASGGNKVEKSTKVSRSDSHTLYAHWRANKYTVSFDANGGSVSSTSSSVKFGSGYGELPVPTRANHGFAGWYTSKSGGNKITSETKVNIASNHTLYAHWDANAYTVTLDPNGGTVSQTTVSVKYGGDFGELPKPTRNYYNFAGWYTSKLGGTRIESDTKVSFTSDQSIYAHWTSKSKSGWVLTSNVPEGAKITDTKWTYTLTETTTSTSSSLSGWTQTGSSWSKTGSGTWKYANYPGGFNTSDSLYSRYNKSALSGYTNASTKREVSGASTCSYIYWHWTQDVPGGSVNDRLIEDHRTSSFYSFSARDDASNYPYRSWAGAYEHNFGSGTVSWWWYRFDVYQQTYTDYQKVYSYSRQTTKESSTEVSAGGNISNVKKYVKYIEK